jgi:hypothetical protein
MSCTNSWNLIRADGLLVTPSIPGSIATGFLSLGGFEGERVQKQPAYKRRIETKY